MSAALPEIPIPSDLLPTDGRFCCGPSKVRPEAVAALAAEAGTYLGTSHRQAGVRFMVARLRNGLAELLALPDGYEVLLGNGGTTALWDALSFGAIDQRSHHLVFGEFSGKFAEVTRAAPHLSEPSTARAEPGTAPALAAVDGVDAYCLTHNETSTGVATDLVRPDGAEDESLVLVDATSAAGGLMFDPVQTDVYYLAPQKCLASDGGLWLAACSPAAVARIDRLAASDRWVPASLDMGIALENSRKDQTYNTPALATIFLAVQQVEWLNENGGLPWAARRCATNAAAVYDWADASEDATPFVTDPDLRSQVVATIDLVDDIDATTVAGVLRANGVQDTESYRKLGRNQLRFALFPAIEPDDVAALTRCVDHVVAELRSA